VKAKRSKLTLVIMSSEAPAPSESLPSNTVGVRSSASEALTFVASERVVADEEAPGSAKKERKRCCVKGCNNHLNLQRVPPLPKPMPLGVTKDRQVTQAKRILKREEFLERLGRRRQEKSKDLRFCGNHKMETQKFAMNVSIKDSAGLEVEVLTVPLEFYVPVNVNQKPAVQGKRKRCCVRGCNNHISLQRVPPLPKQIPLGSSKARQITRAKKVLKRTEYMKRLGYNEAEFEKHPDLRFCPNHKMETKNWTFAVSIKDEHGVETECVETTAQFAVPVQFDKKVSADDDDKEDLHVSDVDVMEDSVMDTGHPSAFASVATVDKKESDEPPSEFAAAAASGEPMQSVMM